MLSNALKVTIFIICIFAIQGILKAQVQCPKEETAPLNNSDGSGVYWTPYSNIVDSVLVVFGYPTTNTKHVLLNFSIPDRSWKLHFLYLEYVSIQYLGNTVRNNLKIELNENTKTDIGNEFILSFPTSFQRCRQFFGFSCRNQPAPPPGKLRVYVEIPDWDQSHLVTTVCQGDAKFDLSPSLINTLIAYSGKPISGAQFYVDGVPMKDSYFDPSLYTQGDHIITAQKTYCNSYDWGIYQSYISPPYHITITGPPIQFPLDSLSLCTGEKPTYLLASPVGGVWQNLSNGSDPALSGNLLDPSKANLGKFIYRYYYTDPTTSCTGHKDLKVEIKPSPDMPQISGNTSGCDGAILVLQAFTNGGNTVEYQWWKETSSAPIYIGSNFIYTINGSENLLCYSKNTVGCLSKPTIIPIQSYSPKGDFNSNYQDVPFGGLVSFTTTAIGDTYLWDFGDGGVAFKANPFHYYYNPGDLNVKLTVTSAQGCTSVFEKKNYIHVQPQIIASPPIIQPQATGFDPAIPEVLSVFPSPFKDHVQLNFQLVNNQSVTIQIFDLQGHTIKQMSVEGKKGSNTVLINQLGFLSKGLYYMVKITSSEINHIDKLLKL